jgi:catechol 2,3-dioxygenase-like lactoylglutathione lyase family enzyme
MRKLDRTTRDALVAACLEAIEANLVVVDEAIYAAVEDDARSRSLRDSADWPVVATALVLSADIWTNDNDFPRRRRGYLDHRHSSTLAGPERAELTARTHSAPSHAGNASVGARQSRMATGRPVGATALYRFGRYGSVVAAFPERLLGLLSDRVRTRLCRIWAVAPSPRMKDVQHADGGSGSDNDDRCQIESKADEHQHGSRSHAPQDRMNHDPVTEPAPQIAHPLPHPPLWTADYRTATLLAMSRDDVLSSSGIHCLNVRPPSRRAVGAAGYGASMAVIAKMRAVVLDCPDPRALAAFYRSLLGGDITYADDDWVNLRDGGNVLLSFQRAREYQAPDWPSAKHGQQFHIDVTVDDVDQAEPRVLALGARRTDVQPGIDEDSNWRVYLDPAGHPFCLCWD